MDTTTLQLYVSALKDTREEMLKKMFEADATPDGHYNHFYEMQVEQLNGKLEAAAYFNAQLGLELKF
jgi:hypothetical protein